MATLDVVEIEIPGQSRPEFGWRFLGTQLYIEVVQWTCTPQLSKIGLTEEMMR